MEPFLANRDLILTEDASPDLDQLWQGLEPAVSAALAEVEAMRATEGETLAKDLNSRLDRLHGLFQEVAAVAPQVVEAYRLRLSERMKELLEGPDPDPQRLAMEVAILAEKSDVTEEAVRAQSHLVQFRDFLKSKEPVGRKLDFLAAGVEPRGQHHGLQDTQRRGGKAGRGDKGRVGAHPGAGSEYRVRQALACFK